MNYNVRYFLEQCLNSLYKAVEYYQRKPQSTVHNPQNTDIEIFVVDNNSVDGSVNLVKEKFNKVRLIENKENSGFAKANNIAIRQSDGEYILMINPDTVIEDDTIEKVLTFMDSHPDAGGLGVKMLNGKGKFLPESKRGVPTPETAFYKISGLAKLFPKSKKFGKYHLGYLDKDQTHKIPILAGAFMLLRKEALDKIGLLDETFFMYGEDIDLSYRLIQAGYNNYYYPEARIIHYKGESTKKSSINYVLIFYKAMIIFAKKHFSKKNARLFSLLVNIAIYLRAFVAIIHRLSKKVFIPAADIALIYGGILLLKNYWEHNIIKYSGQYYPDEFMTIVIPAYIFVWLLSVFFSGGYDKPVRIIKIIQGILIGTVIILVIYAMLPESIRYSRALIPLGAIWAFISMYLTRLIVNFTKHKTFYFDSGKYKRFAIVGEKTEAERVVEIIKKTNENPAFIGLVNLTESTSNENEFIGNIEQLNDIAEIYKIDEIIFCGKDIPAQKIMDLMSELKLDDIEYKIAPSESLYIIGSNSISHGDNLYIININSINNKINKRNKRLIDIIITCALLFLLPFSLFIVKNPFGYLKNLILVFTGYRTWVGYNSKGHNEKLPHLRNGVLNPADSFKNKLFSDDILNKVNTIYAEDYKVANDINIIFKGFRELGRK